MVNRPLTELIRGAGARRNATAGRQTGTPLKPLETILDELSQLPVRQPSPATDNRGGVEWDEDLFVSGPPKSGAALPKAASIPERPSPSEAAFANRPATDPQGRPWPTLPMPARQPPPALEKKLAEQTRELTLRCAQVAELHAQQGLQAAELQVAKDEIKRLADIIAPLRDELTQRDAAAIEQQKQLAATLRDNAVLRDKLAAAQDQTRDLLQRMATLEAAFDDRETIAASALADLDVANAKLAGVAHQAEVLVAAAETAERRNLDECKKLTATIEDQAKKIDTLFSDQNMQFRVRDKLAKQYDELSKAMGHVESENRQTKTELEFQTGLSEFLETMLRVERETADERIKQLTEALESEKAERSALDQASAVMRQEVASLLAQLSARRHIANPLDQAAA
jgi:chromosome segregation ATPase